MDLAFLRVLVVDDFPSMRKLLLKGLRQMGVGNIQEARDGTEAVQLLETNKVDLIVSDWNMPDMGGLELLRWVRNAYSFGHMPFLMVTSKGQQADVVQAVKAGVDSYIVKPFTQEILEAKVTKLLGQATAFSAARDAAADEEAVAQAKACREAMDNLVESSGLSSCEADPILAAEVAAPEAQNQPAPESQAPSDQDLAHRRDERA